MAKAAIGFTRSRARRIRERQDDDEEQMVEAVEKAVEAGRQEDPGRLVCFRIETDERRVVVNPERADASVGTNEVDVGGRPVGEPASEQHAHRKRRGLGPNRKHQLEIEESLVVIHLCGVGQLRAAHARERALVGVERTIGRQRDARVRHLVARQPLVAFQKHDAVRNLIRRLAKRRIDVRHRQIARAVFGKVRVSDREQRNAQQHLQLVLLRPDIALNHDFVGDVVRDQNRLQRQCEEQGQNAPRWHFHEVTTKIV